jgi:hypothetical protein
MRYHLMGFAIAASLTTMPAFAATPEAAMTKECGACHMVYPASQLPARSWTALMAGLANHFGENAALDAATTKQIADLLTATAADASGRNSRALKGLSDAQTPLRITETPYWIGKHGKGRVSASALAAVNAKSPSNCVACHAGATRGQFDDD